MTAHEKNQLVKLNNQFEEFIKTQQGFNTHFNDELKKINRGLYGDDENRRRGLIARQEKDEARYNDHQGRIVKIESFISNTKLTLKTGFWVSVAAVVITLLVAGIIDLSTIYNIFK